MKDRKRNLLLVAIIQLAVICSAHGKPNLIVYMVDDMGWNHLDLERKSESYNDSKYNTPNLSRIASEGLVFRQAYAQPNCAPTRAAMLSGQYPARINNDVYVVRSLNRHGRGGITKKKAKFLGPEQSQDVAPAAVTIAEAMKKNGYRTAHIGKYHVGGHEIPDTMPEDAGFDINVGGGSQGHQSVCFADFVDERYVFRKLGMGHFDKYAEPYGKEYLRNRGFPDSLEKSPKHISDALGDSMEDVIGRLVKDGDPFYLQFHSYAVHGPVKPRPDLLKGTAEQKNSRLRNYIAFMESVDLNLGRMLDAINDPNQDGDTSDSVADNTLILFTSDNGGTSEIGNNPLRGIKGMFYEGGIRVPLIAYWPGRIPAGKVTDHVVHCLDYYPTLVDLAGGGWLPDPDVHPLDGYSFKDVLLNPDNQRSREPVFFLFPGYMDTRAEPCVVAMSEINGKRYKLMYFYDVDIWEMYCLTDDLAERDNIFGSNRPIAKKIRKRMVDWLNQDHPTWKPKYPIDKKTGKPAGPPPAI